MTEKIYSRTYYISLCQLHPEICPPLCTFTMRICTFILSLSSVTIASETLQESSTYPTFTSTDTIPLNNSADSVKLSSGNPEMVTLKPRKKLYSWWTRQPLVSTGSPEIDPASIITEITYDPGQTKTSIFVSPQDRKTLLTTTEKDGLGPEAVTPYIDCWKIKGTLVSAFSRVGALAVNAGEKVGYAALVHKAKKIGSVATEVAGAVGSTVGAVRSAVGNLGSLAASAGEKVFEAASSKFGKRREQKDPEPGQDNGSDTEKEQGISSETEPDDDLSQTAEDPSTSNASGVLTPVYNGSNRDISLILIIICLKVFSSQIMALQL